MTSTLRNTVLALGLSLGLLAACSSSDDGGSGGSGGSDSGGSGGKGGSGSGGKGGSAGGNSGGSGGSSSGPGAQTPDAQDAAGWKKFLEAGEFRKEGWKADVAAPRPKKSISPHGRVRVWFNEKAKSGQTKSPAVYEKGSVIVKEMFDDGAQTIGYVSIWKTGDGSDDAANAWLAHCAGDKDRCVQSSKTPSLDEPVLGDLSTVSECKGCHHSGSSPTTGLIYTKVPQ
ncbi:MAG: hypothetical protein SF187_21985 [Deltaproteobacteria bacterium]|nr:hypothetical protein [Deltaproteobacteria bacterium]